MNKYAFEQGSRLNRKVSWHFACFPGNAGLRLALYSRLSVGVTQYSRDFTCWPILLNFMLDQIKV